MRPGGWAGDTGRQFLRHRRLVSIRRPGTRLEADTYILSVKLIIGPSGGTSLALEAENVKLVGCCQASGGARLKLTG